MIFYLKHPIYSDFLTLHWLNVLVMSRTCFRVNPHFIVAWMSRNSLLETGAKSASLSDCNRARTHNHLVRKRTLNHLIKLVKWLSFVVSTYLYGAFNTLKKTFYTIGKLLETFYQLTTVTCISSTQNPPPPTTIQNKLTTTQHHPKYNHHHATTPKIYSQTPTTA